MDTTKIENLIQVLSDYLEDAGAMGHTHKIELAQAAINELGALTDGAVTWDDFLAEDEDEE